MVYGKKLELIEEAKLYAIQLENKLFLETLMSKSPDPLASYISNETEIISYLMQNNTYTIINHYFNEEEFTLSNTTNSDASECNLCDELSCILENFYLLNTNDYVC